jgi:hypothetical protein
LKLATVPVPETKIASVPPWVVSGEESGSGPFAVLKICASVTSGLEPKTGGSEAGAAWPAAIHLTSACS